MTSKSPTESNAPTFENSIGYLSGRWLALHEIRIGVNDVGFRQGVTAVERLRTYSGKIFCLDAHLDRLSQSVEELHILGLPSSAVIKSLLEELMCKNARLIEASCDVGVTVFATPGDAANGAPSLGLHLNELRHAVNQRRREHGQPIVVTNVRQPPTDCWPRSLKSRSRIHYYRADNIAQSIDDEAVGVLIDDDGSVTETSIANLAMVDTGSIVSPPSDRVLAGITQSIVESIAAEAGIRWTKQPISTKSLQQADEVLLMGTDGGIWFARSVNQRQLSDGSPGMVFLQLRKRFDEMTSR